MTSSSARAVTVVAKLFSIVLAFVLLVPAQAVADDRHRPFSGIVVFGDSLSDPGNVFALNGGVSVSAPDYGMGGLDSLGIPEAVALIPEAPYVSRRFSNGLTWVELLGGTLGLGSSVKPAVAGALIGADDGRASNYAVGGATAANLGVSQFPLGVQVGLFLADVRYKARSDALYVIAIGGNDIRAALVAGPAVLDLAVGSVGQNIRNLYDAGARKFVVWNAPNLGRAPALQRLDRFAPGIASGATALSAGYNEGLEALLQFLSTAPAQLGGLPGIEIVPFNAFESLEAVATNPRRFGLQDATTACIQPNVPQFGFPSASPFRCAQPDRHFFWDGIHPTRAGHAIIAFLVGKALVAAAVHDD